uniref:Nucleotide-diphospho-sugar transferase domain-containing protein n=1 Tax=Arundo donax TaxID=35708 RepID=A0A0A9CTE3_ARUDO
MLQRIKSYIAFLEQKLVEFEMDGFDHFVLTDSDIAVVDDLGHIFRKYPHCHLALTFRNNKGQPLNSGFVAIRGTRDSISKAVEFFKEVLEAYSLKYMKASRMLGDQLALAWVVKSHLPSAFGKFSKHDAFTSEVNGASVLFLPCAVYNWTPPEGAGQFHGMPLDVKVVHFKGSRKRLMLEAWKFYDSTSVLSDTLCLILKSGRTKYDF